MKTLLSTFCIIIIAFFGSCNNASKTDKTIPTSDKEIIFAKEPNDSGNYKLLKYDFYLSKSGQLCERKLAMATDSLCNCLFEVYYDSIYCFYSEDTIRKKPLKEIVDINSFVEIDSTEYSKDINNVFHFYVNSDGGIRSIIERADPITFKRLCEYRWGIDKNYVFYRGQIVEGVNLKHLQVLYPPDTANHFIDYIKDDKNVFYQTEIVKGADAKTFRLVSGKKWHAEDKLYKYEGGTRQD